MPRRPLTKRSTLPYFKYHGHHDRLEWAVTWLLLALGAGNERETIRVFDVLARVLEPAQ